jgi:hypothetical protein
MGPPSGIVVIKTTSVDGGNIFVRTAALSNSVTRLAEISPFGRNVFGVGSIFYEIYRPNNLGTSFSKHSLKIHLNML